MMNRKKLPPGIKLVCFDVFGTLIEILDRRDPYATLIEKQGTTDRRALRRPLMTTMTPLKVIEEALGFSLPKADVAAFEEDVAAELRSTQLRHGVCDLLASLPVPYALCSNLSADYLPALDQHSEICPVHRFMSCEIGLLKPEPEIYAAIIERTGLAAGEILFTGDTAAADIEGPAAAGMQSVHIDAFLKAWP